MKSRKTYNKLCNSKCDEQSNQLARARALAQTDYRFVFALRLFRHSHSISSFA